MWNNFLGTCGIGVDGGCVALSCSANGQAQVPPPAPVTPPQSSCDVHSIYGEITGNYNLRYTDGTGKSNFQNNFWNALCKFLF